MCQGVTEPLDPLPAELAQGCWIALASNGCSLFLGTLDKNRAFWSVGFYAASDGLSDRLEKLQRGPAAHHDQVAAAVHPLRLLQHSSCPILCSLPRYNMQPERLSIALESIVRSESCLVCFLPFFP